MFCHQHILKESIYNISKSILIVVKKIPES